MPWSDTDTMLTMRRRIPIGVFEQKVVETQDFEHPKNVRGRASHHEVATDGRRGLRRVDEATDPGRIQERQTSRVDGNRGRSPLEDLRQDAAKRLDRREIELAIEGHHDLRRR